ncbi:MAG: hypothetical protein AAF581_07510 [Planctomycetota bacterium]
MIPWELLGRATVPEQSNRPGQGQEIGSGSELVLYKRGEEYSIRVDNWELMNSRSYGSEEEVAVLACERLFDVAAPCVLVGGLGLGFTLRTALDQVSASSRVVIAELVPEVVTWNREFFGHLAQHPLDDERVEVYLGDAAECIRSRPDTHDAIILDVDNGPHTKQTSSEGWLYSLEGLAAIRRSLRSRGIVSIWSTGPADAFTRRIEQQGFDVEEVTSRGRGGRGTIHHLWIAQRDD